MPDHYFGSLRTMRAAASHLDLDSEALRYPARGPYVSHVERTLPPVEERAAGMDELAAWCETKNFDSRIAVCFALYHAIYLWMKRYNFGGNEAFKAVGAMHGAITRKLTGQQPGDYPEHSLYFAGRLAAIWFQNDKPFEKEGALEAQRFMLLMRRRGARKAH